MASIARWCFRHRFVILGLWLAGLFVLGGLSRAAGDQYTDTFSLPGTESTRALDLLQKSFAQQAGDQNQIVWHVRDGSVQDPAVKARVESMLAKVKDGPHVQSVASPYARQGAHQISRDGRTAYATVAMDKLFQDIPRESYEKLIDTAQAARSPDLQVELGGSAIQQVSAQEPGGATEGIGILLAGIVLFIAFGSLLSTLLPLVCAI